MPTLNQRRKDVTRFEIAEAAVRLFARDGFHRVTAEMISQEAGVSLRTFYRYFSSKDDVLRPIVELRAQSLIDALVARPPEESLPVALLGAVRAMTEPWRTSSDKPFVSVLAASPELFARWLRDEELWEIPLAPVVQARLGDSCTDSEAHYTAAMVVTALRVAMQKSLVDETPHAFAETLAEIVGYLGEGAGLASDSSPPTRRRRD